MNNDSLMYATGKTQDLVELTEELRQDRGPGGRELSLAHTKLQEARFWLLGVGERMNVAEGDE